MSESTGTTEPVEADEPSETVDGIEPAEQPKHWWSAEHRHSRRAAVGAVSICTALALIVAVVWALPGLPVAVTAGKVAEVIANPAAALLKTQNELLASKVTGLRKEVRTRDAALAAAYGGDRRAAETAVSVQRAAGTTTAPVVPPRTAASVPAASTPPAITRPGKQPAAVPGTPSSRPVPATTTRPVPTATVTAKPVPAPTVTVTAKPAPTPSKTPTPAATPPKQTTPLLAALTAPSNRYFGLYTEQAPFNWATYDDAMTKLAASSQTVGYFSGWDEAFRANAVTRSWSHGLLPIMTWESRPINAANNVVDEPEYSLHRIIQGDFDDYLRTYARSIVATGLPLGIRLDHEMNGTWYPWAEDDGHGGSINGNSPGEYAAMWRHVHDVFTQEGANDYVFWIWSPNRINKLTATHRAQAYLQSLYPGDEYVDWVGLSGYLRPAYAKDDDFSFDYTYGSTLRQLRAVAPGKRILLSEIGASETGGHKVAWLGSLFDALAKPENADIVGAIWFDLAVSTFTEGQLGTNDWRVDSRPETLAAFKAGLERTDTGFGPLPWDATGPAPAPTPGPPAPTPTPTPVSSPTPTPTPARTPTPTPTPTRTTGP